VSYDLYFKPRTGALEQHKIAAYFSSRPNYKVDPRQVWYENKDTGVYFVFEMQSGKDTEGTEAYPGALNINYFRPSYFIQEAEPEITAFVRTFDMVVADPQMHGMGTGEYVPELLRSGWNYGNEFGYAAMLGDPKNQKNVQSLPSATLLYAWSWNLDRQRLQNNLGESKFVPIVLFIFIDGEVKTSAIWPDGIPIAVPKVDYLIVPRKQLAPRRLFQRVEDRTIVALRDALPILHKHGTTDTGGTLVLDYNVPTDEIAKYVTSLPSDEREIKRLSADQVLDRELVTRHLGRGLITRGQP
jgi:hypothetical protein